jgi:pilin isopeptide linkage protein
VTKDDTEVTTDVPTFTNIYTTAGSATIQIDKALTGHALSADQFTFQLLDKDRKVIRTAKNDAGGKVTFIPIIYRKADAGKKFNYTVHELDVTKGYVKGSDIPVEVTVENDNNVIKPTVSYPDGQTITNTYSAIGSTSFTATKTLSGELSNSDLKADEFTFELSRDGSVVATGTNDENGNITFKTADGKPYTADFVKNSTRDDTVDENGDQKVYTYTMREVIPEESERIKGMDYDETVYTFAVSPVDMGNGEINCTTVITKQDSDETTAEEVRNTADVVFNNTLNKVNTAVALRATKVLTAGDTNQKLQGGEFFFDLYEGNKLIETATNDASGNITFKKLEFGATGTHTYTIKEENAGDIVNGIRYTSEEKTVTINVDKDENGVLVSSATVGDGYDKPFVNEQLRSITVKKDWEDDDNNSAGLRPGSVNVSLLNTDGSVYASAALSADNNWTYTFENLPYSTFTVREENTGNAFYEADNNGIATADTNTNEVTITNRYTHPKVTIIANKVLNGDTLTNGEFLFQLHRNSDPDDVYTNARNDASGQIIFSDIEYDPKGYTVTEVKGDDSRITYDSEPITYSADGDITSTKTEFTNTIRPIVLRVQKRSREYPYDPLVGATYGLYQVVSGGNNVLVESQVSDENGYMYFGRIEPDTIYYFKEIAAPEGHEVDPYDGQKFQVKYTDNGQIGLFDENGKATTVSGDITVPESQQAQSDANTSLLVQQTDQKTKLDTKDTISYNDGTITAVADDPDGVLPKGTTLKVTQLSGEDADAAAAAVEEAYGDIKNNIVYYDVTFYDADGKEFEPAAGTVTVTIQYNDSLALPDGVKAGELQLVHLKNGMDATSIETVPGTVAVNNGTLLETSFTSSSFSTFGVVVAGADSTLGDNYMVTAAGVADFVSKLNIAKLDTSGKYVKGAKLQIIEKSTGNVMAEWDTADGPESFARWFDDAKTRSMNVDTYYILHEVSAPDGYELADDIMFMINKYDSSITVYKYDDNGNLVVDQEAVDQWVSDQTLEMIDVPVEHKTNTVVKQKTIPNEKTIQGEDRIVNVTSIQAVKTGDTTPIALFVILLAAAAAVLLILVYRERKKKATDLQETA